VRRAKRGEDTNALVGNLELAQVALVLLSRIFSTERIGGSGTELDEAEGQQVLAENRDRRAAEIELATREFWLPPW